MQLLICENCGMSFESNKKRKHCGEKCRRESQSKKNKRRIKKYCKNCGKEFEVKPHNKNKEFCSIKCAGSLRIGKSPTNKKEPIVKICSVCNKEYSVSPHKSDSKFCSKECHYNSMKGRSFIKREKSTTKCLYCGKEFELGIIASSKRKYCSQECYYNHLKDLTGSSDHPYYNKVERVCLNCGKKFLTKPAKVRYGEGKFCTKNCQGSYMFTHINTSETSIEIIIANVLDELNFIYEKQKVIGYYVCDFYLPNYNMIIEADGDYWHNIEKVKRRDRRKNYYLHQNGYNLLRIWEKDIHKNPKQIILEYINKITA